MKNLLILILLYIISLPATAQESILVTDETNNVSDSTIFTMEKSLNLISDYYNSSSFLNHTYDYETTNKIKKLRMQSRNVYILGGTVALGVITIGSILAINNNWSLWIYVPCATVITIGSFIPFGLWATYIESKAKAIEEQIAYLFPINNNIDFGIARYSNRNEYSYIATGVALKIKF